MTEPPTPTRLPGSARHFFGVGGYAELWLASDELYYLTGSTFAEHHMRFRLRDIQAITLTETKSYAYMTATLIIVGICGFFAGFLMPYTFEVLDFFLSAVIPFIVFLALILHLGRGPSCVVTLHTRAHTVRLSCLRRQRTAIRAIAALHQAIEQNQPRRETPQTPLFPSEEAQHSPMEAAAE